MNAERKSYLFGTEVIACIRTWKTSDSEINAAVRADGGRHTMQRGIRVKNIVHEPVGDLVRVNARYICMDCGQVGYAGLGWTHDELYTGHTYPEPFEQKPMAEVMKILMDRQKAKEATQLELG